MQRAVTKAPTGIRMTNAQIHADNAVRQKITVQPAKNEFKLKRFQNVNPRTSTKRGSDTEAFMVNGKQRVHSTQELPSYQ